ncbi:secretin receptor [Elysia marginata]|uniref:Secretin receptor n=1 Tax=Elysia marginata TaxID=1093978 RepID=A0AAV4IFB0_9GAST|nr:secretin receptor [Elysia marginata]
MSRKSSTLRDSHSLHCPADYDQLSQMCWPPTPAGQVVEHPCTPDGFLNPNMFARRTCLPDATWFVNTSFDTHPYTDYTDCLTPWVVSEEEKLRKLAGDKIVRMLNSLDSYRRLFVSLYIVAIFLLAASVVACIVVLVQVKVSQHRLRSFRRQSSRSSAASTVFNTGLPWPHMPHMLLAVAALVLLVDNVVSIILSSSGWPDYLINCQVYKSIDVLSMLVFYQCLLGYVILAVSRILRYRFKRRHVRIIVIICVILTSLIVGLELLAEVVIFPTHYCGFGNMEGSFHWLFTGPKYLIIMCTICLAFCNGFGAFCLHQPSLGSERERKKIRTDRANLTEMEEEEESHPQAGEGEGIIKRNMEWWFHRVKVRKAEDVMTLRHIRQGSVSVIITIVFSLLREVMVVLLHFITAKNISASLTEVVAPHAQISNYARMYALVTCVHGIVFAVAMCFCDVRVLATLSQCLKSRSCGWHAKDSSDSRSPPSPSSPAPQGSTCWPCFKAKHKTKRSTIYRRQNASDVEGYRNTSPGRDVITPILGFPTPSPQHARCLPMATPHGSKKASKGFDDPAIALADIPNRDTFPRPVLRPTIEPSPRPTQKNSGNGTHSDLPSRYKSRYTYRQVSH